MTRTPTSTAPRPSSVPSNDELIGIPKIDVMVRNGNAATRGFYEALGYTLDDVVVYSRRFG